MVLASLLAVLAFTVVHLFAPRIRYLDVIPRSRWLSAAGGVSVAYVFVDVLPELAEQQRVLAQNTRTTPLTFIEHHAWLIALAGLVVFYGVERVIRKHRRTKAHHEESAPGVFAMHIGFFALYNLLIGYLLAAAEVGEGVGLLWYGVAVGGHLLVVDYGLRHDHPGAYDRAGRWVLVGAGVLGWALGLAYRVHDAATAVLFAFLAGGIILNVLKEELPEERESRFPAFLLGAALYAALLLMG